MSSHNKSKRQFLKTVTYATPVILTMAAAPSKAKTGSGRSWEIGGGNDHPHSGPDAGEMNQGGASSARRRGGSRLRDLLMKNPIVKFLFGL